MSRYWNLDDIEWDAFCPELVDKQMLAVVKTASLVEANAPDYVTYLCNVFDDDPALCALICEWGREEEQHGAALARWATLADPDYDFDAALKLFRSDYQQVPLDTSESVRGSRTGELFARCIVESGTSSFYLALHDNTDEPALKQITANIAADEVRHYKLFRRHLDVYEELGAPLSKLSRCRILSDRFTERTDDEFGFAYYAANVAPVSNEPYDREHCISAYDRGALGIYRKPHLERFARMILKAIGFGTGSPLSRAATGLAWLLLRWYQRKIERAGTVSIPA